MENCAKSGSFFRNTEKVVPPNFKVISEGCADVIFENEKEVFYNNVQVINRDLSILVIQQFIRESSFEKIEVLEALAATGLRSIRYWKEIEGLTSITCNDLDEAAFESIKRNVVHNDISLNLVKPSHSDCNHLMYDCFRKENFVEVIDLDPYGTAIPFLGTSLKAIRDGGMLCVTCTDLAVLCGSQKGSAFGKYGVFPIKKKHCHESALRLLLASIQRMASVEKKVIEPVLCLYIDFYVRVFIRVKSSAKAVRKIHEKHGYLFNCTGCTAFKMVPVDTSSMGGPHYIPQSRCEECESRVNLCGPLYMGPIHDSPFIERVLSLLEERGRGKAATFDRIKGLLTIAKNEVPDSPLFYHLPNICASFRFSCPKAVIVKSALLNLGYQVSRTHCTGDGIKTNAPSKVVLDVFRRLVKEAIEKGQYGKLENKPELARTLMSKEITTNNIDFSIHDSIKDEVTKSGRQRKVKAFFPNPEKYWGPKSRAHGGSGGEKTKKKKKSVDCSKEEEEEEVIITGKKRKRGEEEEEGGGGENLFFQKEEEEEGESPKKKIKIQK